MIPKAAAPNAVVGSSQETSTLAEIAMRNGVDYYPNAGKVVKVGEELLYPYAVYKAGTPMFQVDPAWPKSPEAERNWTLGDVPVVDVDAQDNVWIINRPKTPAHELV